jgi:sialate O-acetylesterase
MKKGIRAIIGGMFMVLACTANAKLRLPQFIGDGMVLQRDVPVKVWGWARPHEPVVVSYSDSSYTAEADGEGRWEQYLPPQPVGGPHTISVQTADSSVKVRNVLFGDVWLCAGQSNMETPVSRVMPLFGDEIRSYANPHIRYVKIPLAFHFHGERSDIPPCRWEYLTPETALSFSAVAYFFAREMYERTHVPVGIINSAVGGSPAEAWMSEEALQGFPALLNDLRLCRSDTFVSEMQRLSALPAQRWNTVLSEQDLGLREGWAAPDYDDSDWASCSFPDDRWGRKGRHPANGAFWFRKGIFLSAEEAAREATLHMGRIIDADSAFVNGVCIGTTSYQYPPRTYGVPTGLLHEGHNLIAVRLISYSGFPAFVPDKPYRLDFPDSSISLEGEWKHRAGALMPPLPGGVSFQNKPSGLYNAMIAPLRGLSFKGVLWYQGEANTSRYDSYFALMDALVSDWRKLLGDALPFLFVQLANYLPPSPLQQYSDWAELRDVQRRLADSIPHSALTVTIDLGEWNDIHPLNKKDVGLRLALQARRLAYGEDIVSEGPRFLACERTKDGGLVIRFAAGTDDLLPVERLNGFALAGADGVFLPARAIVHGRQVIVRHDSIPCPAAVRYAWADNPQPANLLNRSLLPASPFQYLVE